MAVLHENDAFSTLVLSVFLKRFSFSRKFVIKLKYSKLSKFPVIATQKRRAISKIPSTIFRKNFALSADCKMKPSKKKCFPVLRQKLTQILP